MNEPQDEHDPGLLNDALRALDDDVEAHRVGPVKDYVKMAPAWESAIREFYEEACNRQRNSGSESPDRESMGPGDEKRIGPYRLLRRIAGGGQGAVYLSLYNELFVNLEQDIGDGRKVDYFDRNRTYVALGYSLTDNIRLQFGYMHQETDDIGKGQLQFNLIHRF